MRLHFAAISLALAVIALGLPLAAGADERRITVTGEGRALAAPDIALVTLGVSEEARTAGDALAAMSRAGEAILAQVFEEQIDEYIASARDKIFEIDRLSRTDFAATLRAIVDMELDQRLLLYRMEPEFYSTYQQSLNIHERVDELTVSMNNPSWGEWFTDFLAMHLKDVPLRHLTTQGKLATHALSGALDSAVAAEPQLLETPEFREGLFTLLLGYLERAPAVSDNTD